MICRDHDLSISRQAELLGISRGSVYYTPAPVPEEDLDMMRRMDALHLEHPWMGSRMLRDMLERQGVIVGRKHVTTLMRRMGITALYRKPNTSKRHPGHKVYPYLLRGLNIDSADKVWAMDITYIPMKRGFVYLCAVVDWASRRVLSHRVSVTMDVSFCLEALEEAFSKYGKPDYFNTDQGSQFTSLAFTDALKEKCVQISMDGKGCWRDNVFVERIWKSLKYEEVYLHAYETVSEAKAGIARYFRFYNSERPHSSLGRMTPDEFYFQTRSPLPAVA
jgi:putative transposase